jgi:hypothetical protein
MIRKRIVSDESTANEEQRQPVAEVLRGLTLHPLVEGESAEEAFVLIKIKDAVGDTSWAYRTTRPPNREELFGALTIQVELLRRELLEEWE